MEAVVRVPAQRPVGAVTVTHDSGSVLGGLLESLPAALAGLDWRLVVVDNGSSDGSAAVARRTLPGARVVEVGANPGFATALNLGVAELPADCDLLVLNPDVRLAAGTGAELQARLRARIGGAGDGARPIGIVAPRLVDAEGALLPSLRFEPTARRALAEAALGVRGAGARGWGETVLDRSAYRRPTVSDWVSGAVMMISRECLVACGPWDESFFLYSEDAEFALRARDLGFATALVEGTQAIHLGGNSRTDPALWSLLVRNKVVLYRRRHGRLRAIAFRTASLLRELRFALSGNRPSRAAARALLGSRGRSR